MNQPTGPNPEQDSSSFRIDQATEAELRIIRIAPSGSMGDPLVQAYAERHRASCAIQVLSWRYFFLAIPLLLISGSIGSWCWGPVPPPP
ncbi:MAG: hypothetical protein EA402_08825, partial [Planctomycetota bacterium]